ncbi:serine/threonine protein kinase [Streptacidiphilus sp. MAP12-20]|uniref:serine/threonine-protein kinase n=1 Tax=Streptacidiphilus sp. MAP12-20 TaxID=3156299 RepID=UPI0035141822
MVNVPERIGRYTVARDLGSGGMGEVFLGYSPAGDPVALKVIRADRLDPLTRARFEKEAQVARTVVGTNRVARFLDADPYAERPWMAMEYVPGRTLLACVDEDGPLAASLVASLGALLAEGLQAVHAAGLLHRDLKPQNIMMGEYGPVVIDFGLAAFADSGQGSLSHSGMIIGTVRCMPPEQASGQPQVTSAADVYALGTVLLYAASGRYPYDGVRWEAIAAQVVNPEIAPDLAGAPAALLPLLTAMLEHEAESRPSLEVVAQTCTELLRKAGLAPAQARRILIDRSCRSASNSANTDMIPDPLLEDRLRAQPLDLDEQGLASPLNGPPGATAQPAEADVESPAEAVDLVSTAPAEPAEGPGIPARVVAPRVPAARRIAQELRTAYAQQSAL